LSCSRQRYREGEERDAVRVGRNTAFTLKVQGRSDETVMKIIVVGGRRDGETEVVCEGSKAESTENKVKRDGSSAAVR
jgi:hypothetical protein